MYKVADCHPSPPMVIDVGGSMDGGSGRGMGYWEVVEREAGCGERGACQIERCAFEEGKDGEDGELRDGK